MVDILIDDQGKAYTVNGEILMAPEGGSAPVIEPLSVTPTTSAQTITAPSGTDGYSPVNVAAVTSAIDQNITAGNIKDGVTILGVTGEYTGNNMVGQPYIVSQGVYTPDLTPFTFTLPYNAINLGEDALSERFVGLNIEVLNLSSLSYIFGDNAMNQVCTGCEYLTTVYLTHLSVVSGNQALMMAFSFCPNLSNVYFNDYMVYDGFSVTGESAFQQAFSDTGLEEITIPVVVITGYYAFANAFNTCPSLHDVYFPLLHSNSFEPGDETAFNGMLDGDDGVTVHFPSNLQSVIGNWQSVIDGFGGTNTTVLFDLTATE